MGADNSKIDPNSIEKNLLSLISRLQTDTKIEKNVAYHIRTALTVYSQKAKQVKNERNLKLQKQRIVKLIENSNTFLDHLSKYEDKSYSSNYGNKDTNRQNPVRDRDSRIKHVKEKLKSKQIKPEEAEQFLKLLLHCSQQLDNSTKTKEIKHEICVLILELFIKTSAAKSNAEPDKVKNSKPASIHPEVNQKRTKSSGHQQLPKSNDVDPHKSKSDISALTKSATNQLLNNEQTCWEDIFEDIFEKVNISGKIFRNRLSGIGVNKLEAVKKVAEEFIKILKDETESSIVPSETQIKPKKENQKTTSQSGINNESTTSNISKGTINASQLQKGQTTPLEKQPPRSTSNYPRPGLKLEQFGKNTTIKTKTESTLDHFDVENFSNDNELVSKNKHQLKTQENLKILNENAYETTDSSVPTTKTVTVSGFEENSRILQKMKASIEKYDLEVQNFRYTPSSNEYQTKRNEIIELFKEVQKLPEVNEKQTFEHKINTVLRKLHEKASANEKEIAPEKAKASRSTSNYPRLGSKLGQLSRNKTFENETKRTFEQNDIFQQLKKDLDSCEINARQFSLPTRTHEYQQQRKQISHLQMSLNKVQPSSENTVREKLILNKRIAEALNTLENNAKAKDKQEDYLKDLSNFENQLAAIKENENLNYQGKRHKLDSYIKQINSIKTTDAEVCAKKTEILNRIQDYKGNLSAECKSNLLQCHTIFEKHKAFILQDFPGSTDVSALRQEIIKLADYVQQLPNLNESFQQNKQGLHQDMMATLGIFDEKIQNQNQIIRQHPRNNRISTEIIETVDYRQSLRNNIWKMRSSIDKHKSEIRQWRGAPYPSTNHLYQLKKKELAALQKDVVNISEDNEFVSKDKGELKAEISEIMKMLDENAYVDNKPTDSSVPTNQGSILEESLRNNLQKIKVSIDKYDLEVHNFRYTPSSIEYQTKRNEIIEWFKEVQKLPEINEKQTFGHKINTVLSKLHQKASANEKQTVAKEAKAAAEASRANLLKIQTSLHKLQTDAKNFAYPASSKAYQRKRDEVIALQNYLANIQEESSNNNDKQSLDIKIQEILNTLDGKALENEKVNRNLEILGEIENAIDNMGKSDLAPATQINVLEEHKKRVSSLGRSNTEVSLEKAALLKKIQSLEENIKKQISAVATETGKPANILDLQNHFDITNFNNTDVPKQSTQFIEMILQRAKIFVEQIQNFKNTSDSMDYFLIDENLMRLLEELDKIKCQNNKTMLDKKLEAIKFIKLLQRQLDANVVEG